MASAGNTRFRKKSARVGLRRTAVSAVLQRVERYLGIHVWAIFLRPAYRSFELGPEYSQFEFRCLTEADLRSAAADPQLAMTSAFIDAALARGDACFGAWHEGRLIAYLWRSVTAAPLFDDLWIRIDLQPQFYGYKTLVLPQYRGLRLFQVLRALFDPQYVEHGLTEGVSYVAVRNLPSIASVELDPELDRIGYAVVFAPDRYRGALLTGRARQRIRFERRDSADAALPVAPA
jgi:hypothetical protein